MSWSLGDIQSKVREYVGMPAEEQLSSANLNTKIQQFYQFTMPNEIKNQVLKNFLNFRTTPNTATYSISGTFLTNEPKAYCDGQYVRYYQNPDVFFQDFAPRIVKNNVGTGDGATANYTGTVNTPPLVAGSFLITGQSTAGTTLIITDDGSGNLIGNTNGTTSPDNVINYVTGAFNATFNADIVSGGTVYVKYDAYTAAKPQGILFYENKFTVRPIPDEVYQMRLEGFVKTGELVTTPTFEEWGQYLALGVALDIFLERGDMQRYNEYMAPFKRYENIALARTIQQYSEARAIPTW